MVGGLASIGGTVIGVFIISLLQQGIMAFGLGKGQQMIITGIIVIVAVYADVSARRRKNIRDQMNEREDETMGEVILTMKDIDKSFPGVHALDHVNFEVKRGEVHALMGENGAGKSTLMKVLTGIYQKDSGSITYKGKEVVSTIHVRHRTMVL